MAQWFSAVLMLRPLVLWGSPTLKLFLWLFHDSNFATVMNCNHLACDPSGSHDPQVENRCHGRQWYFKTLIPGAGVEQNPEMKATRRPWTLGCPCPMLNSITSAITTKQLAKDNLNFCSHQSKCRISQRQKPRKTDTHRVPSSQRALHW